MLSSGGPGKHLFRPAGFIGLVLPGYTQCRRRLSERQDRIVRMIGLYGISGVRVILQKSWHCSVAIAAEAVKIEVPPKRSQLGDQNHAKFSQHAKKLKVCFAALQDQNRWAKDSRGAKACHPTLSPEFEPCPTSNTISIPVTSSSSIAGSGNAALPSGCSRPKFRRCVSFERAELRIVGLERLAYEVSVRPLWKAASCVRCSNKSEQEN